MSLFLPACWQTKPFNTGFWASHWPVVRQYSNRAHFLCADFWARTLGAKKSHVASREMARSGLPNR